jgi:hypothetical protein
LGSYQVLELTEIETTILLNFLCSLLSVASITKQSIYPDALSSMEMLLKLLLCPVSLYGLSSLISVADPVICVMCSLTAGFDVSACLSTLPHFHRKQHIPEIWMPSLSLMDLNI